jgi:hypothetical protein
MGLGQNKKIKDPRGREKSSHRNVRQFFEVNLGDKVERRLGAIIEFDPWPLHIRRKIRPAAKLRKPSFWSLGRRPNPL